MSRAGLAALLAHWRRHPLQAAALVLGLALATALWSGVQAVNAEARASYARAAGTLGQQPLDRLVAAAGIAPETFAALRREGYLVTPVITGSLDPGTGSGPLELRGIDPLTAPPEPALAGLAETGTLTRFLTPPGLLLVAPETAARLDGTDLPPRQAVAGLAPGLALTDIATAARLLDRARYSHLLVLPDQPFGLPPLDPGVGLQLLPPESGGDLAALTDSFHLNLTAFGLLSFGVGLFIVQSGIGLAFEQRRGTFRTLRALGLSLRRLILLLAAELALIATLAGLAGLVLGYLLAAALLPGVAGTLRSLYGAEIAGALSFDPVWAAGGLAMTYAGTALAGGRALIQVARMPLLAPARPRAWALVSARTLRLQAAAAAGLALAAAGLALWGEGLLAGFACLAALMLAAALALPPLLMGALTLARPLARGPVGEWLLADARQQVPALSLALMALLLALAANIGVGTMVGSFRATFTGWLDQRLAAELYVTAADPDAAQDVARLAAERGLPALPIWSVDRPVLGRATAVYGVADHVTYRENWPLIASRPGVWDSVAAGEAALINEQLWRRADLQLGDALDLGAGWRLPVAGVYSDYGNPEGQVMVASPALAARHPEVVPLRFALRVPEGETGEVTALLRDEAGIASDAIIDQARVKAASLRVFERTFLVTGALNVLTLGVAGFAMLTSLLTLATLRLPQLAPLWALGLRPATLGRLELARSALLAALTWALAVPVGLVLAWVLLAIVNVEAFGWRLPMRLFPGGWLALGAAALAAALLASLWPVLRLARMPPARLLGVFANDR
ncbi:FtsX-like permease family protein [Roseivivax sp. CAU 1761]